MERRIPVIRVGRFTELDPQEDEPSAIHPEQHTEGGCNTSQDVSAAAVGAPVISQSVVPPDEEDRARARRIECRDRSRLVIEALAFLVGGVGLFALIQTLNATRDQAEIADRTFRATQRAVVAVGLPNGKVAEFLPPHGDLEERAELYIRNAGNQTAYSTDVELWFISRALCVPRVLKIPPFPIPQVNVGLSLSPEFYQAVILRAPGGGGMWRDLMDVRGVDVTIVGRITYRDEFRESYCEPFTIVYDAYARTFRLQPHFENLDLCDGKPHERTFDCKTTQFPENPQNDQNQGERK